MLSKHSTTLPYVKEKRNIKYGENEEV